MRGQANGADGLETDPLFLMHQLREEGLAIKSSALGVRQNEPGTNQELLEDSDGELPGPSRKDRHNDDEMNGDQGLSLNPEEAFLQKLSTKQKRKLLRLTVI